MKKKIFNAVISVFILVGMLLVTSCGPKTMPVEDILSANKYETVLAEHNNILTKTNVYADEAKQNLKEKGESFLTKDASGKYTSDAIYFDAAGNHILSTSYRDGLMYEAGLGAYAIEFVNLADNNQYVVENFAPVVPSDATYSEAFVEKAYVYYEVSYELNGVEIKSTYYVDADSLLYTHAEHVYKVNGAVTAVEEAKYYYGVNEFNPEVKAIDLHQNAEDKVELTVFVNHKAENEVSYVYTVSGSSRVTTADKEYRLYKNVDYTKDVINLEYIDEYASVYYLPVQPEFNFEYRLTEADHTEFTQIAAECQAAVLANEERAKVEELMEKFNNKFEFIEAHYTIGQVNHYRNMKLKANEEAYEKARDMYYDIFEEYKAFCRAIYESESIYKEEFFEDWTEEDIEMLYVDPVATEIREAMTDLEEKANKTNNNYNAPAWKMVITGIYKQYVEKSKEYASFYNYENYYEYATEEVYGRDYTKEDLDAFHQYVKEYIVPLTVNYMKVGNRDYSYLTPNQKLFIDNLNKLDYDRLDKNYVDLYINSFDGNLKQNFKYLFEKNAAFFEDGSNAYAGAFVNYISYYEEPFAYFGPDYKGTYTIVHEMGHYASAYSYNFGGLNYDLAETHSQANEWLFSYFLKDHMNEEAHDVLVAQNLAEALQMVCIATVIDAFEQAVYYGDYMPTEYEDLMKSIFDEYGMADVYDWANMQIYYMLVAPTSPVYYISYATSQIASINLYVVAEQQGYEAAQEVYRKLQEEGDDEQGFVEVLELAGLPNPFEESTYTAMLEVFNAK